MSSVSSPPPSTAGTPSLLRAINERSVLAFIERDGPLSRAHVARQSGLSKPTVSVALAGLLDAGLVREVGRMRGTRGPSALMYEVNPQAGWVVGIDVGRRWVRAAIADIAGTIVARKDERASLRSADTLIAQIGAVAHSLAKEAGIRWSQVTHAALGGPGVFDQNRDVIRMAPNLPAWERPGLVDEMRRVLGTNLTVENDVNLAALAEQAHGIGRGVRNFVYLSVGTGIGMGLILNGDLYTGAAGGAGEIGYLPVGAAQAPATRGHRWGPLEEAAAAAGMVRSAIELGMKPPLTAVKVFTAARRGDPIASKAVAAEAELLARAIAIIAPIVDPELVVLGGGIGRNGDLLIGPIERELRRWSPLHPQVKTTALGDDAVLQGAVATALQAARERVFSRSPLRAMEG